MDVNSVVQKLSKKADQSMIWPWQEQNAGIEFNISFRPHLDMHHLNKLKSKVVLFTLFRHVFRLRKSVVDSANKINPHNKQWFARFEATAGSMRSGLNIKT